MAKAKRMKEEQKTIPVWKILSVIVIIIVILLLGIKISEAPVKQEENNFNEVDVEKNTEQIKEEKTFENLTIKNIDVKYENGNSFFKLELANESDVDFHGKNIKIVFENEDGSEFTTIKYNLGIIKSKESFYINTGMNIDLTQASDFYIENE